MQTPLIDHLEKERNESDKRTFAFFCVAAVCLFVSVCMMGLYAVRVSESRLIRATCGSFTSYGQALIAYQNGASWLDGDADGVPCNALYMSYIGF